MSNLTASWMAWKPALLVLLLLGPALNTASAQSKGDYRTGTSGNWSETATWEEYDGTSWIPAGDPPAAQDGYITIRDGHTVTLTADEKIEDTTVEAGGQLTIDPGVTLELKSGDDSLPELSVYGILRNSGSVVLGVSNGKVEIHFFDGGRYEHAQDGGTIPNPVETGAQWDPGSTCAVTGVTTTLPTHLDQTLHHVEWNTPVQSIELDVGGHLVDVNGDLAVISTGGYHLVWSDTSSVNIGGSYVQTGGIFRISYSSGDVSFNPGSDFSVSGGAFYMDPGSATFTVNVPGDFTHTGGRIEKYSAGNADIFFNGTTHQAIEAPDTVGTGIDLYLDNADGASLQANLTVPQDLTVVLGTLDLAGHTLTLQDDLTVNGSLSTTGVLIFASDDTSDPQVLSGSEALSAGSLTLDNGGGTLQVDVDLTLYGDLTRQDGTLQIGSRPLTFSGGQDQQLYDASGTMLLENIAVDKSAGSLILESDLEVSTNLSLTSGTLDVSTNEATLTLISNSTTGRVATVTSGDGRVNGPYNYERYYSVSNAGWRMIGAPFGDVSYSTFNDDFFTQGGDWANHSQGNAILYRFDADGSSTESAQSWEAITGDDASLEPGEGYILYMIEADPDSVYTYLPATLTISGNESAAFTKTLTFNTTADDSYNLVGNPFAGVLDWHAVVDAGTNVGTSYAAWNPDGITGGGTDGHKYYNSTDQVGAAGRYIAPFQAFFLQATDGGASIDFQKTLKSNSHTPVYYGKLAQSRRRDGPSPHVRLHLEGEGLTEPETYLVFNPDAERGSDLSDVRRLPSLSSEHASLWFVTGEGRPLAFEGRSMASGREEYELALTTTRAGQYELSWPDWHDVPPDWSFVLSDAHTGEQVDMQSRSSYVFEMEAAASSTDAQQTASSLPPHSRQFTLHITSEAPDQTDGSASGDDDEPEAARLYQNHPNPANATTTVRYYLTEPGQVRIQLFDLLGKAVARPVDAHRPAGHHEVQIDATSLSAGMYLYVMEAGPTTLVRRMIVVR